MRVVKNFLKHAFLPFPTFIEYQKRLMKLKTSLLVKKSSIVEARKILDTYMEPTQKLSDDILKMREE